MVGAMFHDKSGSPEAVSHLGPARFEVDGKWASPMARADLLSCCSTAGRPKPYGPKGSLAEHPHLQRHHLPFPNVCRKFPSLEPEQSLGHSRVFREKTLRLRHRHRE